MAAANINFALDCFADVWQSLKRVASYNPDLKVISGGAAAGALVGGLAGYLLYSVFGGKENQTAATAAGIAAGSVIGGGVASAWIEKNVVEILEEMGPEKRQILSEIAKEEAMNIAYTIGTKFATRLARQWLIKSFNRASGMQLE